MRQKRAPALIKSRFTSVLSQKPERVGCH
jgi:hypothetical protein